MGHYGEFLLDPRDFQPEFSRPLKSFRGPSFLHLNNWVSVHVPPWSIVSTCKKPFVFHPELSSFCQKCMGHYGKVKKKSGPIWDRD